MKMHNFNYFASQRIANSKSISEIANDQDFDLDLHTMNRPQLESSAVQGSGQIWCSGGTCGCDVTFLNCTKQN